MNARTLEDKGDHERIRLLVGAFLLFSDDDLHTNFVHAEATRSNPFMVPFVLCYIQGGIMNGLLGVKADLAL